MSRWRHVWGEGAQQKIRISLEHMRGILSRPVRWEVLDSHLEKMVSCRLLPPPTPCDECLATLLV